MTPRVTVPSILGSGILPESQEAAGCAPIWVECVFAMGPQKAVLCHAGFRSLVCLDVSVSGKMRVWPFLVSFYFHTVCPWSCIGGWSVRLTSPVLHIPV